jgi:arylsulfatase A
MSTGVAAGDQTDRVASRPNVVLIMADDMGYEALSVNGSESCKSPNLDKLASQGVRFTNCFANPLCTPSRAKIMTGQYNVRNYIKFGMLDRGQTSFAHQLKAAGYRTCIAGKWQLGKQTDSPQHFGFEQSCLWQHTRSGRSKENGKTFDRRFVNPLLEFSGVEKDYVDGEYGPQVCTDFICDFIEKNKDESFLVYYPMILTHCPFDPTPDSSDWDPKRLGSTTYKGDRNDPQRHFRDMVAYADKAVGQIVAQLEKSGVRDDTLLIFTGDNGTDKPIVTAWNGRRVAGAKGTMTDAGTRVPLIASWPAGIKKPGRFGQLPIIGSDKARSGGLNKGDQNQNCGQPHCHSLSHQRTNQSLSSTARRRSSRHWQNNAEAGPAHRETIRQTRIEAPATTCFRECSTAECPFG